MIRTYATQPHYQHHINNHTTGINTTPTNPHTTKPTPQPIITASRPDATVLHDAGWDNIVLIEHGAGQGYRHSDGVLVDASNDRAPNPSVRWWWGPNWIAWRAVRQRLPNAEPVLMAPHVWQLGLARAHGQRVDATPTVGFAVHWPNPVCPEARGGWPHTATVIAHLKRRMPHVRVVVFPHPKMNVGGVRRHDVVRRNPDVIVDADWPSWVAGVDVLVADNTSVMWEAVAIGIPVVGHRPPSWREWDRMPHHGLRFPGYRHITIPSDHTTPRDIVTDVALILDNGPDTADHRLRHDVDSWVYPTLHETPDRLAAAIDAITE